MVEMHFMSTPDGLFVEFITERNDGLGTSSDPSGFSPFGWKNLLEEVGK